MRSICGKEAEVKQYHIGGDYVEICDAFRARPVINGPRVNREGLTFTEWFNAATCYNPNAVGRMTGRRAWERGEDPTEYAAAKNKLSW